VLGHFRNSAPTTTLVREATRTSHHCFPERLRVQGGLNWAVEFQNFDLLRALLGDHRVLLAVGLLRFEHAKELLKLEIEHRLEDKEVGE